MATMELGIRIDPQNGIAFFGVEEVNRRIREGARIIAIRPLGAVMAQTAEEDQNTMVLSGCQIQVVFEDG